MGEYLSWYTKIQTDLYKGNIVAASDTLKKLLNFLNMDYQSASDAEEREKYRKAISRLLPALQALKGGVVTETVIAALSLDVSRLPDLRRTEKADSTPAEERAVQGTPVGAEEIQGNGQPESSTPRLQNRNNLSPRTFEEYVGQERAKQSLRITLAAAKKTGTLPAHILICSPYGYGKTTLASIIANEAGLPFFSANAASLKDVRSILLYFSKLGRSGIVFIDEIHSLKKDVQTALLSIMTDFSVRMVDDDGTQQVYDVPPFTLIGATTQAGELLKPFFNRFSVLELEEYSQEEERALACAKLEKLGLSATDDALSEIVRRSRGIPRTIGIFAKGAADVALAHDKTVVGKEETDLYFELQGIDKEGLTKSDLQLLKILAEADKPLALITLESKSGIQREDIEYRIEPYLLKLGFIEKTERGRIITQAGRKYIGSGFSVPARAETERENKEVP